MWRALLLAAILPIASALAFLGVALPVDLIWNEIPPEEKNPWDLGKPGPSSTIPFETVWVGRYADFGFDDLTYLVIQNEREWEELWNRVAQDPPPADFETRTLLVAIYGQAPTGGHNIEIETVTLGEDGTVLVVVGVHRPGPRCTTIQVITHPVHVVSIPKSEVDFAFRSESVIHECI